MSFNEKLSQKVSEAEAVLTQYLPEETGYQKTVCEAINYSVTAGGKRLRPILMKECFLLFGGEGAVIEPFMAALEMIHNYSLVHDDLPAMDNDEYRRGRKTTWNVYGDGMAVLAGDGLLNLAFETAMKAFDMVTGLEEYKAVAGALRILGEKAGIYGMIGGQTADVEAEQDGAQLTEELLLFIHENKTAALIKAAMMIGAVLAGAGEEAVSAMEKAAYNIGIAFQIQDDILDVTSTTEVLGKPVGSDAKNNKLTYVSLNGLDASKAQVEKLSGEALQILASFEKQNEFLNELVTSLITRVC
ncbi:MAG: polyprenyl synthetase family protein [Lachnospiraceae bacterium]|nr:polyprenyl synthetase family protein [Lachnospiraceae bacterium]